MPKKGSASDRAEVQASINIFYKRFGSSWTGEVNNAVAETFATMMFELRKCSQTMALVPKPTAKITIKYVAKYFGKIIRGAISSIQQLVLVVNYRYLRHKIVKIVKPEIN